jgi:hypothetical protein
MTFQESRKTKNVKKIDIFFNFKANDLVQRPLSLFFLTFFIKHQLLRKNTEKKSTHLEKPEK